MHTDKLFTFLTAAQEDFRLTALHMALYISLFQLWYKNNCQDPISFSKQELMKASKIGGRATYHRCMKELHDYGYISYVPSHHPILGSIVFLGMNNDLKPVTYSPQNTISNNGK